MGDGYELTIEPRAPFRLDLTAWALRRRSRNAVDRFDGSAYRRVVSIDDGGPAAVTVTQHDALSGPRLGVLLVGRAIDKQTEQRARCALDRLLGLSVDLTPFAAMAERDPLLGPLALRLRGLRPPRFATVFEALVNGVACQQLSLDVGIHLLNRLTAAHGRPVSGDPAGPRAFPDPDRLAGVPPEELRRHGFSLSKARTIVETAGAIVAGEVDLESLDQLPDRAAVDRLTRLRGIGRWTAEMVLSGGEMVGRDAREVGDVLGEEDVVSGDRGREDLGVRSPGEPELGDRDGVDARIAQRLHECRVVHLVEQQLHRASAGAVSRRCSSTRAAISSG